MMGDRGDAPLAAAVIGPMSRMSRFRRCRRVVAALALMALLSMLLPGAVRVGAQGEPLRWSDPEQVWGYEDDAQTPFMVADQNRTVHVMNSRTSPDGVLFGGIDITYRRWTPSQGWTEPVDVILSPKKNIARIRGLVLDDEGYLHMVFYGGDEQDASMYYTSALASMADRAPAWSTPLPIGERAGPINDAALVGDGRNRLVAVYTGNRDGMGAYATASEDGGLTWSEPEQIHESAPGQWPTHYALYMDKDGRAHVAWSEGDSSGNGQLLYYARVDENQRNWIQPLVLARKDRDDLEVDTPALIEHDGRLILVYHDDFPTTRFMRQSFDNGGSWTEAERLFQQVGSNGAASLVTDSQNNLYLYFGGRLGGNPDIHGMWQSTYQRGSFATPLPVVSGPRVATTPGGDGFDPSEATAVVVQGNTILLTWTTDPGAGLNGVHSVYAKTTAAELPLLPLPSIAPTVAAVRIAGTPLPTAMPTLAPLPDSVLTSSATVGATPMTPLLMGAASVLLLIGLVFAGNAMRRKR